MGSDPGAPTVADAAMAHQDPVNGRGGRHLGGRVSLEEELVKLAGAPAPGLAELEDLANDRRGSGMRTLLRPMGVIG
jgi:hypothetical protein